MKVYLVTCGDYSDYHIEGAFSSKELAKEYITHTGAPLDSNYYSIEEIELDQAIPYIRQGMNIYGLTMRTDGSLSGQVYKCESWSVRYRDPEYWYKSGYVDPDSDLKFAYFQVWAKDETHAIKICNEKRIQMCAHPEVYGST